MNSIAPAIKRRRLQLGLTQKDMSDRMHVSEKTYRNIETGVTRIDMERLEQIAEVLETDVMELIQSAQSVNVAMENSGQNDNKDSSAPKQIGYVGDSQENSENKDNSIQQQIVHADEVKVSSDHERSLYEKIIADKEQQIVLFREEVAELKAQIRELIQKMMKD